MYALFQVEEGSPLVGKSMEDIIDKYDIHIIRISTPETPKPDENGEVRYTSRNPPITDIIKANDYLDVMGIYEQVRKICSDSVPNYQNNTTIV